MPVYEYECTKCDKIIEEHHSIKVCPQEIKCDCGKKAKKIVSQGTFQLVGSCWMRDDYKYANQIRK